MSQTPAPLGPVRRSRWGRWIRYGALFLVLLLAGIFMARREIGDALARELRERLSAEGVHVEWRSADWNPGSGIKVRGLALYRDAAHRDRLALLSEVILIKGEPEWKRWDTVEVKVPDARLTLGHGESEMQMEHLDVLLLYEPGKVTLQECRAKVQHVRIEAAGTYVRQVSTREGRAALGDSGKRGMLDTIGLSPLKVINQWLNLKPERGEAVVKLKFDSPAEGRGLDLAATLEGEDLVWQGQKWDFLHAAVKGAWGKGKAPVPSGTLRVGLEGKTAEFDAEFDPAARILRIRRFESGLGLLTLVRAMVPRGSTVLTNVASTGAWQVSGEGEIPLDHPEKLRWNATVKLDGDLDFERPEFRVRLQKPACSFGVREGEWSVADFKAGLWGGQLHVPALQAHAGQGTGKPRVDIRIVLQQARLDAFLGSFGPLQVQPGTFDLEWKGGGEMDLASVSGSGALSLRDAGLFSVPQQDRLALTGRMRLTRGEAEKLEDIKPGVRVSLADARLTLGSGSEETTVEDMVARGLLGSGNTELQEFKARTRGLRIEAQGVFGKMGGDAGAKPVAVSSKKGAAGSPPAPAESVASQAGRWVEAVNLDGLPALKEWVDFKPEKEEPVLKLVFKPMAGSRETSLDASLEGRRFQWRGQKWDSVSATVKSSAGKGASPLRTGEVRLGLGGQVIELKGRYDAADQVIRFSKVDSGIDWLTLVRILAPKALPGLAGLSTTGECRFMGKGEIPLARPGAMRWDGDVQVGGELVYVNNKVRMAVAKPAGTLRVQGDEWLFSGLKGRLWGGDLQVPVLQMEFPPGKRKSRFETQVALKDAKLEAVLAGFGQKLQKQPGTVQFDWKGGGPFDVTSFAGTGTISAEDAEFGRLPLFGTLGLVLDKMTPGFGRDTSTRVSAGHRIGDGVIHLENVDLRTQQFRIEGNGAIDLKRRDMEFTGDMNLKGVAGLATRPLRALTEIKGAGPLSDVKWEKSRKGLVERIGDDLD